MLIIIMYLLVYVIIYSNIFCDCVRSFYVRSNFRMCDSLTLNNSLCIVLLFCVTLYCCQANHNNYVLVLVIRPYTKDAIAAASI